VAEESKTAGEASARQVRLDRKPAEGGSAMGQRPVLEIHRFRWLQLVGKKRSPWIGGRNRHVQRGDITSMNSNDAEKDNQIELARRMVDLRHG
jgi:hypothetical protein